MSETVDLVDYIQELHDGLEEEESWAVLVPLIRGLFEAVIERLAECQDPELPVKEWLSAVLSEVNRTGGRDLSSVLKALQGASRAAYGDIRIIVGDKTTIGSGPWARTIHDDSEAMCVSSLGALCYRLGKTLEE